MVRCQGLPCLCCSLLLHAVLSRWQSTCQVQGPLQEPQVPCGRDLCRPQLLQVQSHLQEEPRSEREAPSADLPQQDPASQCSDGSLPVQCLVNPCAAVMCRAGETCQANYCGGCTAVCQKPLPSATNSTTNTSTATNGTTGGACSDGSTPVNCLVDSCISACCLAGEVCEVDYCGGCNAVCKKPAPSTWVPAPTSCADGSELVQCFVDPCEAKQCAEGEQCVRDYCGGCNAVCTKPPASDKTKSGACSDGSTPVNCLVDPCISATCLAGVVCEVDYCGGCNAVCKKPDGSLPPKDGADVSGACADGSQPDISCLDPCSTARCGYGVRCVSNYCGGCTAECKP